MHLHSTGRHARSKSSRPALVLSTKARVFGCVGALVAAGSLIGTSAGSTGAYFTDVIHDSITGTFGAVAVTVNGITVPAGDTTGGAGTSATPYTIQWANMLPGVNKTVTWTVTNTGTATESIWLAFDNSNQGWFNANGNSGINNLGTYGDAQIASPLLNANYDNLNNLYTQGTAASGNNACGDPNPAIAYLPAENHVADLTVGQQTSFTFSFGYSACLSANALQLGPAFANPLLADIIATQQGIAPSDAHNGGAYVLPTPAAISYTVPAGESWNT